MTCSPVSVVSSWVCTHRRGFVRRSTVAGSESGKQKLLRGFRKLLFIQAFSQATGQHNKSDIQGAKSILPRQTKSALRAPDGSKRRGRRTVRFKGMVSPTYANIVAVCVQYTRSGSSGAAWWAAFMAVAITFDFFCVPLALAAKAYLRAVAHSKGEKRYHGLNFTFVLSAIDVLFYLNLCFLVCQVSSEIVAWLHYCSVTLFCLTMQ
jgi:hypothetical protein